MHRLICRTLSVFILLSLSIAAFAQTAQFSGRVTDPSQAVVRGADIRVVNQATGVERRVRTNSDGSYTVPFVSPGTYQVFVQASGFSTAASQPLTVTVGQVLLFDVQLKVGTASQEVTVDAGSQLLNTTDASVSTVIDRKFVENVPLNGRSFQDLISLTPGVVTQSPQPQSGTGSAGDFSVNGQRTESNYYMVDGVSANVSGSVGSGYPAAGSAGVLPAGTAFGTTQSLVSVDALQEFRVLSSTYSAEYGRSPGGQFSLETRSGTKKFHGSAFDYLRNNYFDANDWFNNDYSKPQSPLRQNDFGGTFGGPILIPHLYNGKDKSFFFFSYEGLRITQPQAAQSLYVPNASLRANAPAVLKPILNAFPVQNGTDYQNGLAQFIAPYSLPGSIDSTSVRFDQHLGSKTNAFFRFSDAPSSTELRNLSVVTNRQFLTRTYTGGLTTQLSESLVNNFRFSYAQANAGADGHLDDFGDAVPTDLAAAMGMPSSSSNTPEFVIYVAGTGSTNLVYTSSFTHSRQVNTNDIATFMLGNHQLKAGIDYLRYSSTNVQGSPQAEVEYLNQASVIQNKAALAEVVENGQSQPIFNEIAAFVQDEWRASSRLNVSAGVRWELMPPPSSGNGQLPYVLEGSLANPSTLALAPQGTNLWHTPALNFAPRLGLAWRAHTEPGWETVLRIGVGVFFDSDNEIATQGFGAIGFSGDQTVSSGALPFSSNDFNFSLTPVRPYTSSAVSFPSHLQLPYTLEWNVALEQAIGANQTFTMSYVGSNGRRLVREQEILTSIFNPDFPAVIVFPSDATSSYNALQVQYQRRIVHGLQALASYSWSHSLDLGSTYSQISLQRGDSDFDVRNSLNGALSWSLPAIRLSSNLGPILNHWSLDGRIIARSAFPIPLQGNFAIDPTTGNIYYSGVNLVPNQPVYLYGAKCSNLPENRCPGGRTINQAAFSPVVGSGVGTAPRNFVRGFGETQVNLAARHDFPLHDDLTLQFRAEAFNILNHPNFGYIDPTLGDATFGQATQMLNQSLATVASQYQQGGPRSMQFALKLTF